MMSLGFTSLQTLFQLHRGDRRTIIERLCAMKRHTVMTRQAHDVNTTSPQRRCNVMTLHRRWGDVIFTSCARWGDEFISTEVGPRTSYCWPLGNMDAFRLFELSPLHCYPRTQKSNYVLKTSKHKTTMKQICFVWSFLTTQWTPLKSCWAGELT